MRDLHVVEDSVYPLLALLPGHAQIEQRQLDILIDGQLVDQIERLKDEADRALRSIARLRSE